MTFQFQYPFACLLLLLPPVIYFLFSGGDNQKDGMPTIFNPNFVWFTRAFGKNTDNGKIVAGFSINLFIIWTLITLALMHPQRVRHISNTKTMGYDIMLAVDLSRSMMALDFADLNNNDRRNRLDVIKQVASKFIMARNGDRIGLILFGDSAYLQTPLTQDRASVATMLDLSEIGMAGDATAIGDAIALAVKALLQRPEGSRIIILLTDGSNTAGVITPMEAARLAKQYGIKIYCIGVGRKGAVPFPTELGGIVYARIEIDEEMLKKIAEETGGEYYPATDEATLKEIYKNINKLEKTEAETSEYVLREQLFRIPLMLAMIFMLMLIIKRYNWSKVF
jgi:Ca-activated chloride channel family protein